MNAKERFINACLINEVDRPPVWMMRQAGRYLPEYRAIKEKHPTKEMMQTPELACEITLQPVELIGVDAAILYSDILMIPDAMGMGLEFRKGEGPHFNFCIDSEESLNKLNTEGINERLSYVFETVKLCIQNLPNDYPLLGFAGAPFTVACYMIAGKGSKTFYEAKTLAFNHPKVFKTLMNILTEATIDYLQEQANGGVVAVQLFDTWAGLLSQEDYHMLAKPYTDRILNVLKEQKIPTIHYIKGGHHLLNDMQTMSSKVIGIDWRVDLKKLRDDTYGKYALQGNFDPDILMTNPEKIETKLKEMIQKVKDPKKGYIMNLGHGIGQFTPVAHAKHFVAKAKELGEKEF